MKDHVSNTSFLFFSDQLFLAWCLWEDDIMNTDNAMAATTMEAHCSTTTTICFELFAM